MGNDMFNDEQLADAEVRAQASGIILSREAFLRRLHVLADTVAHNDSLLPSEVDLSAHDAALRAEVERLKKELAAEKRRVIAAWEPYLCGGCIKRLHQGEAAVLAAITGSPTAPAEEEGSDA